MKIFPGKKALINFALVILAIAPPIIYSYEYGPNPGYSGAPGDNKTGCQAAGCHVSTPNTGGGSVTITVGSGGATYTPGGGPETVTVTVSDVTKNKFGFELTARQDSSPTNDAGMLTAGTDGMTQVVTCASSVSGSYYPGSCGNSLHWIEHTLAAFDSPANKAPSFTYTFSWTPPVSNVGTITFYVGANAGAGSAASPEVTPTNTYLANVQLSPATGGAAPTISTGGVVPAYSTSSTIAPGEWVSIYGNNLIPGTTPANWNGDYPITLGGTTVTVDGNPAYLSYASPTLINLETPDDANTGTVNVTVTNSNGTATATVTLAPASPSFLLLDATHVAAIILRSDGSGAFGNGTYDIVGPAGTSLGYKTVPAKAGDSVVLFGTGFGPTSPAVPAGKPFSGAAASTNSITLSIGSTTLTPCGSSGSACAFAGLSASGLYQFNMTIPSGLGTGDQPLSAIVNGVSSQKNVVISLQ